MPAPVAQQIITSMEIIMGRDGTRDGTYTVSEKNISNIIDCHSKKCLPVLIIFGTNDRPVYHLTQCLLLHYLGKNEPTKYALK